MQKKIVCLLNELGIPQNDPIVIYQDNKNSITVCEMPRSKSKHLDVKHCVVRDQVTRGLIKLIYCSSSTMTADVLTKGLPRPKFTTHLQALGLLQSPTTPGTAGM